MTSRNPYVANITAGASPLPAGMVSPFAGLIAPSGWLICAGQTISRVTFSNLFSVIGIYYGSGDGVTTFNLPDMRGRVPAGLDQDMSSQGGTSVVSRITSGNSGFFGTVLGQAGGDERVHQHSHANTLTNSAVLSDTENANHSHSGSTGENASTSFLRVVGVAGTILDYNHAVGRGSGAFTDYSGGAAYPQHSHPFSTGTQSANHRHSVTSNVSITNAQTGSGNSQNVQPTIILNYIIKF